MADESFDSPHQKEEGVRPPDDPRYPPHSVLRSGVRRSALFSSVGLLVVLAIVIGLGMLYWVFREKGRVDPSTPQAVGTVGTAPGGFGSAEGGGDPAPRPDTTGDEIERRGGFGTSEGAMPPLGPGATLTEVADISGLSAATGAGQRVELRGVEVASGDARTFQIRDGGSTLTVVGSGDAPVKAGRTVDVKGLVESDGRGGVRVRAQQVDVH
jgi:hypothetical protein